MSPEKSLYYNLVVAEQTLRTLPTLHPCRRLHNSKETTTFRVIAEVSANRSLGDSISYVMTSYSVIRRCIPASCVQSPIFQILAKQPAGVC